MKVTFSATHSVFAVKAPKDTLVSLSETPTQVEDGVYKIGDNGVVLIDEQYQTDSIYLSTAGNDYTVAKGERIATVAEGVEVWAGSSGVSCPFAKGGKGGGGSSGGCTYKGTTTTAIENGSTTNPITIDGEEYTAVFGDIVVYGYTEFVFDGTTWSEFGRPFDTTPTSNSANAVTSDGIKTALDTKQNIMQYAAMPTITASMLGKVVQYVGTTGGGFTQGYFYIASSDGAAEPTYSWVNLPTSPRTYSETVLYTASSPHTNNIELSQAYTNFDDIVIVWKYSSPDPDTVDNYSVRYTKTYKVSTFGDSVVFICGEDTSAAQAFTAYILDDTTHINYNSKIGTLYNWIAKVIGIKY